MVSVEWEELNLKHCERLWVRLYVNDVDFIVVGVCYRSPDADENEISQLFECIKVASDTNQPVLIMGDFKYLGINWSTLTSHTGNECLELVLDCFLQHLVNGPTRLNNTLDLVLTNELQVNDELRILAPPQTVCKR